MALEADSNSIESMDILCVDFTGPEKYNDSQQGPSSPRRKAVTNNDHASYAGGEGCRNCRTPSSSPARKLVSVLQSSPTRVIDWIMTFPNLEDRQRRTTSESPVSKKPSLGDRQPGGRRAPCVHQQDGENPSKGQSLSGENKTTAPKKDRVSLWKRLDAIKNRFSKTTCKESETNDGRCSKSPCKESETNSVWEDYVKYCEAISCANDSLRQSPRHQQIDKFECLNFRAEDRSMNAFEENKTNSINEDEEDDDEDIEEEGFELSFTLYDDDEISACTLESQVQEEETQLKSCTCDNNLGEQEEILCDEVNEDDDIDEQSSVDTSHESSCSSSVDLPVTDDRPFEDESSTDDSSTSDEDSSVSSGCAEKFIIL